MSCGPMKSTKPTKGGPKSDWAGIRADPNMMIEIETELVGDVLEADVTLWSSADRPNSSETDVCPTLPADTTATVNGQPMRARSLGQWGGYFCEVPQWEIADPTTVLGQETVKVRIANSTGAVEAELGNVGTPRSFEIISPTGGVAHSGDQVTVKWSPQSDRFDRRFSIRMDFENGEPTPPAPPTWRGIEYREPIALAFAYPSKGMATFTVPPEAVGTNIVRLWISGNVGVSKCDVGKCELEVRELTNAVALRIEPK